MACLIAKALPILCLPCTVELEQTSESFGLRTDQLYFLYNHTGTHLHRRVALAAGKLAALQWNHLCLRLEVGREGGRRATGVAVFVDGEKEINGKHKWQWDNRYFN